MSAGDTDPPRLRRGQGIIIRPDSQVQAIRADAERAIAENAAEFGTDPDLLIPITISWATGKFHVAPFTQSPTPDGATPQQVAAEIAACHAYLRSTPYSDHAAERIDEARDVCSILEWLTGVTDMPPVYTSGTQPGELTGGHGPLVRTLAEVQRMRGLAQAQADARYTGWGSGPGWYQGVLATLDWIAGPRQAAPMAHPGTEKICTHPPAAGVPASDQIHRELGAAEEHIEPAGYQHGDIAFSYADAVACTLHWLYGHTTRPPAEDPQDSAGQLGSPARLPSLTTPVG